MGAWDDIAMRDPRACLFAEVYEHPEPDLYTPACLEATTLADALREVPAGCRVVIKRWEHDRWTILGERNAPAGDEAAGSLPDAGVGVLAAPGRQTRATEARPPIEPPAMLFSPRCGRGASGSSSWPTPCARSSSYPTSGSAAGASRQPA